MAVKLPTASSLDRAIKCPASCVLPHVITRPGKAANKGTAIHVYLENVGKVGPEDALAMVAEEFRGLCSAIDIRSLPTDPSLFASEMAVAWDYVTGKGRLLGQGKNRDYSGVAATELTGTADVISWAEGLVVVADYKSGFGYVPPARWNPQLRFLALAASSALGVRRARVAVIKVREGAEPEHDVAELDALDLDEYAGQLKRTMTAIFAREAEVLAGRSPDVKEGGWCKYCPAFVHCPGKVALLSAIAEKGPGALAAEDMPEVYRRVRSLQSLSEAAMDRIKELARREPFSIGDGMMFGSRGNRCVEYRQPEEEV